MRVRVGHVAVLVPCIFALVVGCGGDRGAVALSAGSVGRTAVAPLSLRCREAPVLGPSLARVRTSAVRLPGIPDGVATSPDRPVSFVALQGGVPRIAVVAKVRSAERLLRTLRVPAYPSGMMVTPDGRYVLGAAGRGVVVLDAAMAASGAGRAVLGSLTAPSAVVGSGPGAAEIAVSRDSRYAFVTLEGAGAVAVFDLHAAMSTGFRSSGFLGSVRVGAGALGIAASPDGRWLYEVSESAQPRAGGSRGALNVINLRRALSDPAQAVIATAAVPCAPVRVAVSPAGRTVWVTARDANALLAFSAATLRSRPSSALVSITRVGAQPLGLGVADAGRRVLVADSNLSHSPQARAGVSVVDTASTVKPKLLGSVPTGKLADAISVASSSVALVTNSDSRQVVALDISRLP